MNEATCFRVLASVHGENELLRQHRSVSRAGIVGTAPERCVVIKLDASTGRNELPCRSVWLVSCASPCNAFHARTSSVSFGAHRLDPHVYRAPISPIEVPLLSMTLATGDHAAGAVIQATTGPEPLVLLYRT